MLGGARKVAVAMLVTVIGQVAVATFCGNAESDTVAVKFGNVAAEVRVPVIAPVILLGSSGPRVPPVMLNV